MPDFIGQEIVEQSRPGQIGIDVEGEVDFVDRDLIYVRKYGLGIGFAGGLEMGDVYGDACAPPDLDGFLQRGSVPIL